MSEQRPEYRTSGDEDLKDAMEMLGTGYEPSLEIHPEITVIRRRGQEMKEEVIPAFVKISTDFKKEMAKIDEISLKVWLFIALSVNRFTGKANPGLRTISDGTGFAVNTIRAALERLEHQYHLLIIDKEKYKYNIYEPLAFVSANKTPPTGGVSADDTPTESVSVQRKTVSVEDKTVSPRVILNQINQKNQINSENENSKIDIARLGGIDWMVAAGLSEEDIAKDNERIQREKEITDQFEQAMGFNPLSWDSDKNLKRLKRFLLDKSPEEIKVFASWSRREYSTCTPAKVRQNPNLAIDLWPQAFSIETPAQAYRTL